MILCYRSPIIFVRYFSKSASHINFRLRFIEYPGQVYKVCKSHIMQTEKFRLDRSIKTVSPNHSHHHRLTKQTRSMYCSRRWQQHFCTKHQKSTLIRLTSFGLNDVRMLGCWDVGMLGCWDVWMLGCWDVGMLGCWDVGMLVRLVMARAISHVRDAMNMAHCGSR